MKTESITSAENSYLQKTNKTFSYALLAHIPVAIAFAIGFDSGLWTAILGSFAICSCPVLMRLFTSHYKLTAIVHAMSLMFFSGLVIHLSKGMIETHFHIFVSIACLILYANPIVILSATLTIAVHHLAFFFLLPASVFNYQASLGIVLIHAAYVIVQTVPCMWVAKKFGDYVIKQGVVLGEIDNMYTKMNSMIKELKDVNKLSRDDNQVQSSTVVETSEAIQEISMMAVHTSENASESRSISEKTKSAASQGHAEMTNLASSFNEIKKTNIELLGEMDAYNSQLAEIVSSIREIASKTQIINDIVFQTKLLSFNASVESARAGEHGKGFAVVAEEVGNLAEISGKASKEINDMILSSVQKVDGIVESTKSKISKISEVSRKCISDGELKTNQSTRRFDELVSLLNELDHKVNDIHGASKEQNLKVQKINDSIKELEKVNQRSVQSQDVSNNVSQNLSELSEDMGGLVNELHVA